MRHRCFYTFLQLIKRSVVLSFVAAGLLACQPEAAPDAEELALSEELISTIDRLQLPDENWQLTSSVIQLSFCRNRINDALLAESEELNRWRLVGEPSVFPTAREQGLKQLAGLHHEYGYVLWQQWGTVSSQLYRLAYPRGASEPSVFNALAALGRDESICYSALDASSP